MTTMTDDIDYSVTGRTSGWVVFSGAVLIVAAVANLLYGITLLVHEDWIVLTPEALIRFDLTSMGIALLITAALQFLVAMGVFNGELWARILGIIIAGLSVLTQMSFMSVYPAWSWLVIIIDGLVIYGLSVHGDEVAEL